MGANDIPHRRAHIAAEAAEWAVRLQSETSVEMRGEFVDWLRESPLHVAEMLRFAETAAALGDFTRWDEHISSLLPEAADDNVVPLSLYSTRPHPSSPSSTPVRKLLRHTALLAASIGVVAVGALFVSRYLGDIVITTQQAERREITLADGSVVNIAPDSSLRIHLTSTERAVALDRGEALFHVAKDKHRPFVVTSDRTQVRAVGTAFSVERQRDGIVITVAEGVVAVTPKNSAENAVGAASSVISLRANEQLSVSTSGVTSRPHTIDGHAEFAWAESQLIFENNSVAEVVRRFNSRNRLQIRILDPSLASRPVSGVFNASDPQSFVSFLEAAAGAKAVTVTPREILVGAPSEQDTPSPAH